MFEIYTPKAWLAIFGGCPVLRINDNGYIYTYKESTRVFGGTPCGRIDWQKGYIYGEDYANLTCSPIGSIKTKSDGVREIYGPDYADFYAKPILFVEKNKVYTPDEYYSIFGGNPSGYVKPTSKTAEKSNDSPANGSQDPKQPSQPYQPQKMPPLLKVVFGCVIFLLAFSTVHNPIVFAPILVGVVIGLIAIYFIRKNRTGGSRKQAYHAPAKPQPTYQSAPAKSAPTAPVSHVKSYPHTCVKCGSTFYSSTPNPGYNMCIKCRKAAETAAQPKTAPISAATSGKPADFALACSKCGATYYSADAHPAVKLCPACKATNAKTQETKPMPTSESAPKGGDAATFVQKINGKSIFACPFCGAKLIVPAGKGQLTVKCAKCAKSLSVKS